MEKIGFMQGRLSPIVDGRIQSFPWNCWQDEFEQGARLGFGLMEWTLDQERLYENPLLTKAGQAEIRSLCQLYRFAIPSLTGDCFMQAPFWKAQGAERETLERDFIAIAKSCAAVGISMLVVPLVDKGRLDNPEQEEMLIAYLQRQAKFLADNGLRVVFESDFVPTELARFIGRLDPVLFGINYDIGNSAALGFNPVEEIAAYGSRIVNVHIKDRVLNGTTVPLGTGNADLETVFAMLARVGYGGNFILQTARATDGDHAGVLCRYRDMAVAWLNRYAA
jgi:L-ribulose-5-phosphate 3-epimerase